MPILLKMSSSLPQRRIAAYRRRLETPMPPPQNSPSNMLTLMGSRDYGSMKSGSGKKKRFGAGAFHGL